MSTNVLRVPLSKFAVVAHNPLPPGPRKSIFEIRTEKPGELKAKKAVDRVSAVLDRYEARVASLDRQIASLQARKAHAVARVEKLEEEILSRLFEANLERVDGFHTQLLQRPCPASLVVENEALIPDCYKRQPKTPPKQPDKVLIKAVLEKARAKNATPEEILAAASIGGVRLVQNISLVRK